MWDGDLWVRRAPTYKEYYNVLCILSNYTPLFSQKVAFWIPVMKSGSNFTNNCRWSLTGYLMVRNNNCHRVEICTSGHDARKQVLSCIRRLYKFILFLLHRWKDLKKNEKFFQNCLLHWSIIIKNLNKHWGQLV